MVRIIVFIILLGTLSACSSMQSTINSPENSKKLHAAEINTQLGMVYLEKHEMMRAKEKFLLAINQAPNKAESWYSMAYYQEVTGNIPEARKDYMKAVALAPNQGEVQNNYGTFLCRSGDYSGAIEHFLVAVKDQEYIQSSSAYENAGLCALKIPDNTLARQYFNQAVMQDPNRIVSLFELAMLDYNDKNYRDAKIKLEQFNAISSPNEQSRWLSHKLANIS